MSVRSSVDDVRAQYEALPYPARDPRDEAIRLITGTPSHILEINHNLFAGSLNFTRPFRALVAGGHLAAVGPQIGVGKEADVFAGTTPGGAPAAIKLHRLGRTSFRAGVRAKRDYSTPRGRVAHSWLHLSRLAATKEAAFMGALHAAGFAVPALLAANRHAVLMGRVVGMPLYRAVRSAEGLKRPARVYAQAVAFVEALAARGLVHCDLNEFNLMVRRGGSREREERKEGEMRWG